MSRARVSGVILAAGPSRRFGDDPPKQLAVFEGEPLVRRMVAQALRSQLSEIVVVVGFMAPRVEEAIRDLEVRVVRNPHFDEGQSTSVKVGLASVGADADAAMFVPIDQPRLSVSVLDALIGCYRQGGARIVVPTNAGRRGAPVLFDRALFEALAEIEGDAGGRQILEAHKQSIVEVPLQSGEPLEDVDTLEELLSVGY